MQTIELRCPHCSTRLRLRDQSFVGRTIHCPDCTQPVAIVPHGCRADRGGGERGAKRCIAGWRVGRDSDDYSDRGSNAAADRLGTSGNPRGGDCPLRTHRPPRSSDTRARGIAPQSPDATPLNPPAPQPDPATPDAPEAEPLGPQSLAEWVLAYRDRTGHYPIENPAGGASPPRPDWGGSPWSPPIAIRAARSPSGRSRWIRPSTHGSSGGSRIAFCFPIMPPQPRVTRRRIRRRSRGRAGRGRVAQGASAGRHLR